MGDADTHRNLHPRSTPDVCTHRAACVKRQAAPEGATLHRDEKPPTMSVTCPDLLDRGCPAQRARPHRTSLVESGTLRAKLCNSRTCRPCATHHVQRHNCAAMQCRPRRCLVKEKQRRPWNDGRQSALHDIHKRTRTWCSNMCARACMTHSLNFWYRHERRDTYRCHRGMPQGETVPGNTARWARSAADDLRRPANGEAFRSQLAHKSPTEWESPRVACEGGEHQLMRT